MKRQAIREAKRYVGGGGGGGGEGKVSFKEVNSMTETKPKPGSGLRPRLILISIIVYVLPYPATRNNEIGTKVSSADFRNSCQAQARGTWLNRYMEAGSHPSCKYGMAEGRSANSY